MDEEKKPVIAEVIWIGSSREVLKTFPKAIQGEFGIEIWALQQGERPSDYRPMPSIGKGVCELRQRDRSGWYRVIYLSRIEDKLYMLHSFKKQSAKTSKKDLSIAEARLKAVKRRIQEEKKNG